MCTLKRNKVYSTKYLRFRSSLQVISYCTFYIDAAYEYTAT